MLLLPGTYRGTVFIPAGGPPLTLRDSAVDTGFDAASPWAPAATTGRPFAGNVAPGRDLDDPAFNRLWEYRTLTVR